MIASYTKSGIISLVLAILLLLRLPFIEAISFGISIFVVWLVGYILLTYILKQTYDDFETYLFSFVLGLCVLSASFFILFILNIPLSFLTLICILLIISAIYLILFKFTGKKRSKKRK